MILHQQCLRLAVLILLRKITPQRCTSSVPHKSCCREPHAEARLLQAPAEIDIVTRDQITFTKTTNRLQYLFSNRKITPRQMLCLIIIKQNMRRCSLRRGHHHLIDNTGTTIMRRLRTRRQIRSSAGIPAPPIECVSQPPQPLPIRLAVVICVGNDLSLSLTGASISSST